MGWVEGPNDGGMGMGICGPLSAPEHLVTLAQRGEEMGFNIISVSDHVVIPRTIDSRYPYSETGAFAGQDSGACLEQLITLVIGERRREM